MLATIFPFLDFLYPMCASFGPLFLLFGLLARTSPKPEKKPRAGLGFLIAGTVMITFALWQNAPGPK